MWLLRRRRSALRDCDPTTTSCWVLTMDLYCPQIWSQTPSPSFYSEREREGEIEGNSGIFCFCSSFQVSIRPPLLRSTFVFAIRCSRSLTLFPQMFLQLTTHVMKLANLISKPFLQNDDNIQQNKQNLYRLWPFGNLCSCPESKSKCRRSWFLHLILDGYRQFVSLPRRHPSQSEAVCQGNQTWKKGHCSSWRLGRVGTWDREQEFILLS